MKPQEANADLRISKWDDSLTNTWKCERGFGTGQWAGAKEF